MPDDGTYTAVLDRFETGADDERLAVLMLEADGETVGDLVVGAADLPGDARHADAVLEVDVADGALASATYRPAETEERAEAAQDRFDRLSRRLGDEDDA
jgi:hypothetical protein